MKSFLRLLPLLALALAALRAADDPDLAAVRAADDQRVAAILAADGARLNELLSPALHYAHSNGKLDDRNSFRDSLTTRQTIYHAMDYVKRDFTVAAPGVVLMTGCVRVNAEVGPQRVASDLNFLAVWRQEGGRWRFLAWQSCRVPPPAAK